MSGARFKTAILTLLQCPFSGKISICGQQKRAKLSFNDNVTIAQQAPIMIWRANTCTECDYFNQLQTSGIGV